MPRWTQSTSNGTVRPGHPAGSSRRLPAAVGHRQPGDSCQEPGGDAVAQRVVVRHQAVVPVLAMTSAAAGTWSSCTARTSGSTQSMRAPKPSTSTLCAHRLAVMIRMDDIRGGVWAGAAEEAGPPLPGAPHHRHARRLRPGSGGKLNILGGGSRRSGPGRCPWCTATSTSPLILEVGPDERNEDLDILIDIVDEDGQELGIQARGRLRCPTNRSSSRRHQPGGGEPLLQRAIHRGQGIQLHHPPR